MNDTLNKVDFTYHKDYHLKYKKIWKIKALAEVYVLYLSHLQNNLFSKILTHLLSQRLLIITADKQKKTKKYYRKSPFTRTNTISLCVYSHTNDQNIHFSV